MLDILRRFGFGESRGLAVVVILVMRPSRKQQYEEAARLPLSED